LLNTKVTLGNGKDSAFWKGVWCSESCPSNLYPVLNTLTCDSDVSVDDWKLSQIFQFRRNLTGTLVDQFQEMQLVSDRVPYTEDGDRRRWKWTTNGEFTFKPHYHFLNFGGVLNPWACFCSSQS